MSAVATPQPYEVPEGGLASFLTATVGEWSDEALEGPDYYEIVRPTADQLAQFGREGDNRIAHVADGETVIPMEVFEEDPELKDALFSRMREMGINPERYVVGNELNSINPVTGQPEFFLKKIFKGIKKAVKGVVKVFKKIAPIVLSVGLNFMFPGLGAIASGALGSGIGTLVQGGSLKDAFKAALIGGAVGGLSSGIGSVLKGGEFMAGVKSGLPTGLGGGVNPTLPTPDQVASKITEATPAADLTAGEALGPEIMPPQTGADALLEEIAVTAKKVPTVPSAKPTSLYGVGEQAAAGQSTGLDVSAPGVDAAASGVDTAASGAEAAKEVAEKNIFEKTVDFIKGASDPTQQEIFASMEYKQFLEQGFSPAEAFAQAKKLLTPGMLAKYGPMTALGLGVAGAAGAFEAQPMPEPFDFFGGLTREDYIRMYPERYGYTPIGRDAQGNLLPSRPGGAAGGGDISYFPRRNGGIAGPGTETSDDIPAMLSDGEFVMTARAVRGAGNGSRKQGMKRMYDMMRTFEGNAARG